MHRKRKCEILRHIRQDVAERYGLNYAPTECKHQGDCSGTCPKCDAELEDLQHQLSSRGIEDVDLLNIPIEVSYQSTSVTLMYLVISSIFSWLK